MPAELIGQQQGLVKFPFSQAGLVQGDRDNHIDVDLAWQGIDHEARERLGEPIGAAILERADGVFQGRKIGKRVQAR